MNSTDQNLKGAISRNETGAFWCAGAVIFGLVLEVIFAAAFHEPPETFLNHWSPVAADLIVALGVAGEVLFGRKSRIDSEELTRRSEERVAEATTRAAEANQKAAEAQERTAEIERITAWRHISSEQAAHLVTAIREKASALNVLIEHQRDNPEAWSYSMELRDIFEDAGVVPNKIETGPNSFEGVVFTLLLRVAPEINPPFVNDAFKRAGIEIWLLEESLATRMLSPRIRAFNVYIFVGPKPPPRITPSNPTQTTIATRE